MKKAKRFLTGLLSAALALSLCAMPAMAEGGTNEDNNASATLSSIDTAKTGSITIYKYTYNGTEPAENRKGTGEATDKNKVPSEGENKATPLSGVTFTAYQVMTAEQLIQYYDSVQNSEVAAVKISDYVTNNQIIESKVVEKDTDGKIVSHSKETTDPNGEAVIDNLKVGLYAVVETKHPAGVTVVTPAFLVSIPMTKQSTTTKDSQKSEWMYDVTVYPKNQTAAAPITLQKQGKTGGDNTTLTNEMAGYAFKLEKLDDKENNTWITITAASKDGKDNAGEEIGTTGANGQITIGSLTPGIYRFTEVSAPANSSYIVDKKTHYLFKVTTEGTIEKVSENEVPTDANNNFDAVDADSKIVTIVNNKPDLEKKVKNTEDAEEPFGKAADYSAGDLVPYQITVKVPENIAKLKTFTVTDTPTGLKDKKDTIKIVCNNETLAEKGLITNTGVVKSINETNNGGFKIEFTASAMQTYAGQKLVITYEAVLLGKEENNTAVTNRNNAKLIYTNVIETTETPDDSTKTVEDETIVYSFKLIINKIGEDGKKLEGVKFDLYKQVEEDTQDSITGKTATDLGLDGTKSWLKVDTLTTDADGVITKTGLANGTYYLVETKTNEGYNLLSKPVEVVLNKEFAKHWQQVTKTDESGNVTHHEWETLEEIKETNTTEAKQPSKSITVINRKGFDLPVTGGFGTLLFSGIGVLLVVAGVGVLLSLKKKNRA